MMVIFMSNDRKMRRDYLCVNDTTSKETKKKNGGVLNQVALFSNGIRMKETKSVFAHTF